MAQYSQRTQPMHRPGQSEHSHGGGALAYGGKPAGGGVVAVPQPRGTPAAPYAPQYSPQLRLHQPGYGSAALTYRDGGYVRGGGAGAAGEFRGGARVSLLTAPYIPAPTQHPPSADPPPFKKIRFGVDRPQNTALPLHQPLRVDTRESVSSYSTVELSPNPPSESTEDQSFRTTKDDLLQQISKVDREMALSEATLTKLRNKQKELEETASKPERAEEPEETVPRHRSLAQCVYADNRKKASSAHGVLSHLGPPVLYPLYNQPQDTEVYHENIRKHRLFRKHLADHIRRLKQEAEMREDLLAEAYTRRAAEWMRRVERIEQGQKRKAKDARNREFFEKVFPELRKQREERERFNRLGARVKSEAELEEIADGLHEQEHEDKKMRSLTVVPPLLRDPRDRRPVYVDTNRRCMDMESEHKELQLRNTWSQGEREVFREKYLQHPKNFGQIASFLPRKSVRDCVRFYYLSKKAENYKQLLRKPRQRRSARNPPRPAPEPELSAGVTTRLQRSQGAGTSAARQSDKEPSAEDGGVGAVCPLAQPATPARSELRTPPLPPSPPPASSAPPAPVTSTSSSSAPAASSPAPAPSPTSPLPITVPLPMEETSLPPITTAVEVAAVTTVTTVTVTTSPTTSVASPLTPATSTSPSTVSTVTLTSAVTSLAVPSCGSAPPTPQPAQPPTPTQPPPTPEAAVTERVGTPCSRAPTPVTTVTSTCAVCNMPGATRTVSRSRAVHYGLKEDAVGSRVCEPCHCRCVRSRYTRCPVPTCPGPRVRAKRLRHLPPKWHDLAVDVKRPLMEEFQIPSELSKCCLACFKRITRRLEAGAEPEAEPSEDEVARLRQLLREHGPAWDRLGPLCSRSPASLKAFYFTYRKKYQLDAVVDRTNIATGRSSSDESAASSGDTDTCSAGSPRPPGPPGPRTDAVAPRRLARLNPHQPRDEYDSSATETADEESEPSSKVLPPTSISTPVSSAPTPPATVLAPVSAATPPCAAGTPTTSSATVVTSTASLLPRNGPATGQLSVRDVVLNMIEISLTKNSQPVPPAVKPQQLKVTPTTGGRETLATLSVVNSSHSRSSPRSPHRPATITPLAPAAKDGVVVLHIEPRPESRPEPRQEPLLDLSVKRVRHELVFPPPQHQKPSYRNCGEYTAYRAVGTAQSQPAADRKPHAQPQPAPGTKGSITLGTPVPLESRYEPRRTPEPKPGSITLGTPVPHPAPHDKRFDQYYKRRSPHASYYPTRPHEPNNFSPQQNAAYSRSPYGLEQRQIIMADFITSQQMHGGGRRPERTDRPERPERPERNDRPEPRSGSPQYSPQPRREREPVSVIQRHTPHVYPQQHPHPPPGHEAFASLVNVASAATALPVPRGEQEQKQEPKHHPHHTHHDIRLQREMTMAKYQQIHYQALERDRRAQAQYLERDRMAMQQNRERERAMLQERQIAMEQQQQQQQQQQQHQSSHHQQQMMMERQHPQQHQVVSSAEAERRLLGAGAAPYPQHKHRAITPHHLDRKDNRPPVSQSSAPAPAPAAPAASAAPSAQHQQEARARAAEGKLTAASLIDAIITHQISQTSDPQRFPTLRECENSNQQQQQQQQQERQERPPSERQERERDEHTPVSAHTTSIKLGDLASNIITRDFCSPTTTLMHHNSRFVAPTSEGYSAGAGDDWKRRDAPKHAPFLEPVSPPDNHQANRSNNARRYGGAGGGAGGVGGGVLTAFDYVTNRIVEVMRSDADERAKPLAFPAAAYAYPYSALNVATATAPNDAPPAAAPPAPAPAPPPPEPAPLMSAQYEPLSDED